MTEGQAGCDPVKWCLPSPPRERRATLVDGARRVQRYAILAFTLAVSCWNPAPGEAWTPPAAGEMDVKAAFVMNFLRLVNWEPIPGEPDPQLLPVCALGNSEFATAVRYAARGKAVGNRTITVRATSTPDAAHCRVLLVDAAQYEAARPVIAAQLHEPVLTVGNGHGFVQIGGMFELIVEDRRVQFDANLSAVRASKLDVSARLLNLARNLRKGGANAE